MSRYTFDRFVFDAADGRLAGPDDDSVQLRPQAGRLLECLLQHAETVVDRERLVRVVWGEDAVVDFDAGLAALLRELRQALDRAGGGAALVETVPRRGYRLRCVARAGDDAAGPGGGRKWRWWPVAALLVLALLVGGSATFWWLQEPAPASGSHSLAILPFETFGDEDHLPEYADLRLADALLAALWRVRLESLDLIGRAGMRPYAGREDVARAVAEDLGVDLLIEGSLRAGRDGWRADVRLLRIPPGRVLWSERMEGEDEPSLSAIAVELARRLERDWPQLRAEITELRASS